MGINAMTLLIGYGLRSEQRAVSGADQHLLGITMAEW
jgi:hypothetical protein